VDEANMVSNRLWEGLLKEADLSGTKILIVQDSAQIQSREPWNTSRLLCHRFGAITTQNVMRQQVAWQKKCSALLNDGHVIDGLTPYERKGHIHWAKSRRGAPWP
jgi:hypothetical protein